MKNIVIIGANRGIGQAIKAQLVNDSNNHIIATSRQYQPQWHQTGHLTTLHCDLDQSTSIDQCADELSQRLDKIDWLINCAGVLHTENYRPEKALSQVNAQQLMGNYATNAAGHLLLNKKLEKLIAKSSQPVVCSVSARIGSIADNQLGGWYAYRMSKAALNMGYKTLEIEWRRKYPHISLLLVHPGTTDTDLSKPFQQRLKKGQLQSPEFTAQAIIDQISQRQNGQQKNLYVDYAGQSIPW